MHKEISKEEFYELYPSEIPTPEDIQEVTNLLPIDPEEHNEWREFDR